MNRETFQRHLNLAVIAMRGRCEGLITNTLPILNRFLVRLNSSYDATSLHVKIKTFLDHEIPQEDKWMPYSESEVIERLWRDNYVPVWIDVTPYEVDGVYTYFQLRCAGRFTDDDSMLYHQHEGYSPFHCFGPFVPPGWTSESTKFDLHHYRDRIKRENRERD